MRHRIERRAFLRVAVVGGSISAVGARLAAQGQGDAIGGASMSGDGYIPVRRPAKPGAKASLTNLERDAVERQISCPCPCTLDVFTCRTSMPCGFSPRMHDDVNAMIDGGYTGPEIIAAFREAYGEKILMAPEKKGFNLVGWFAPAAAVGTGALLIALLIRRWGARAALKPVAPAVGVDATSDELDRVARAMRED